jgi:hypothetical protein
MKHKFIIEFGDAWGHPTSWTAVDDAETIDEAKSKASKLSVQHPAVLIRIITIWE